MNRVVVISGATSGIGKALAKKFEADGDIVCNLSRSCTDNGFDYKCDVSDEAQVNAAVGKIGERYGRVDILVNNARLDPWRRTADMSEGEWFDRVMRVNLKVAFLASLAFFEQAKARGWGRIVNIASVRSFRPAEMNMIAYGVSKLGMHALTRAFADNGAPYGITANTVAPGMVVTENIGKRLTPEKYAEESAAIPLGRGATCGEIADAVIFPLRNGYVTGETININGGMYYAP